jgi:adenosylcobinamide-GDP ribazoletransferase
LSTAAGPSRPGPGGVLADVRAAVGFLTRLPVRAGAPTARAGLWFPAVGLLVGGLMAGTRALGDLAGLDAAPATVLALAVAILATGGFHEDGLADAADGFGAHVGRARKLEILRDSRVGTYGALAVAFMVAVPLVTLSPLDVADFAVVVLCGHVLGRWSTLPQAWLLAPAEPGSSAALLRVGPAVALGATALAAGAVLALAGPAHGALALGVAAAVTALGAACAVRVLGGVTGDTYGAVNKLVELATYLALGAALT